MSKEQRRRHSVRPGLTGLAQVNGRNNITWEQKFEYDLQYIGDITFWNDVKIIIKTVEKVLKRSDVVREGTDSDMDFGDWLLQNGSISRSEYDQKQGYGGVLETSQGGGYALSWLIEIVGFCGVNCYAIISGFVSYREYDRTWKWENYISLWIKTVTYGVIITLVFYFISPNTRNMSANFETRVI